MENNLTKENISQIFIAVKPVFKKHLGKYTHQRISGEWHFHGMGFVKDEMTYVFGFNIGFYKKSEESNYTKVGMNVLIRRNGIETELRTKFAEFFIEKLKVWYYEHDQYSSFRGGVGDELSRYKNISDFNDIDEIISYLSESIIELSKIYPEIIKNPDYIFDDVLKASFPWIDTIADVCEEALNS